MLIGVVESACSLTFKRYGEKKLDYYLHLLTYKAQLFF